MEDSTKKILIVGGAAVTAIVAYGLYQYHSWKQAAITEVVAQGKTGATNVTQAEFENYLAGTKMVSAFTGTPAAAPTGLAAAVYIPAKPLLCPLLNLVEPFATV